MAAEKKTSRPTPAAKRPPASDGSDGEFRSSPEIRTAFISGNTFRARSVQYVVVDGDAMFEGDIVLGTAEQVERESELLKAEVRGELQSGVLITGDQYRWPNCTVPYDIEPTLPTQARVTDAIAHWHTNTGFRFVLRTAANAAQYPDWVTFRPSSGCSSSVGRRGGQQFVNLAPGCTTGNTIHEIGHVVGIWHEQSREDRDAFVTINWANIQAGYEHNFDQHITDGTDVGPYDYGSIMHYPRTAFSTGTAETITPVSPGAVIGQRDGLSPGDIATANTMCPPKPVIETIKEVAPETIKERAPETIKERSPETVKERIPETTKERVPETIKERAPETIKERAEPPVTFAEGLQPPMGGNVFMNPAPGGVLPFALRTPHQPMAGAGDAQPLDELQAELAGVAEALAQLEGDQAALLGRYQQLLAALSELGLS